MATKKIPADNRYFHYRNANPEGKRTGDCIMRAVSAASRLTWDEVIDELCLISHEQHVAPQDPAAERELVKRLGFSRMKQPKKPNGKKLTGREFCTWLDSLVAAGELSPQTKVLANIGTHHIAAVLRDETGHFRFNDTWDCTTRCVGMWWIGPEA